MNKITFVFISFMIMIFMSCGTSKTISFINYYFYKETTDPQYVVDSLSNVYRLGLSEYSSCQENHAYWTNENSIARQYTMNGYRNDSLFVITVMDTENEPSTIKFRIEHK